MKIGILVNQIERQSIEELLGENLLYNSLKERGADVYILDVTTNSLSMTEDTIKSSGLDCFINKIKRINLRHRISEILYRNKIPLINPFPLEDLSEDKSKSKEAFLRYNIPTSKSCLIPLFPIVKSMDGLKVNDEIDRIAEIVENEVGYPVIIKPARGSRGRDFVEEVIESPAHLKSLCKKSAYKNISMIPGSLYKSLSNPIGLFAEGFLPHALDTRNIVSKYLSDTNHHGCLVRVGISDDTIQKNTSLWKVYGNISIGIDAPEEIKDISKKALSSIISYARSIWPDCPEYGLYGVDIIPSCDKKDIREHVYGHARTLSEHWKDVEETKKMFKVGLSKLWVKKYGRMRDHEALSNDIDFIWIREKLDESFKRFRSLPEYGRLQNAVEKYFKESSPYISEINTVVDYEFQTRNFACAVQDCIADLAIKLAMYKL